MYSQNQKPFKMFRFLEMQRKDAGDNADGQVKPKPI